MAARAIAGVSGDQLTRAFVAAADLRGLRVHVAAVGKAAVQMAAGAIAGAQRPVTSTFVVTKDGATSGFAPPGVSVRFAGHPIPDRRSEAAGKALLAWLSQREVDELVLFLLSGGASSLLATPVAGLTLADLRQTTTALLASGLSIVDVNRVRKRLTRVSAGRVASTCPARVRVVVLADIVGPPDTIAADVGSGPFAAAAPMSAADMRDILAQVDAVPAGVRRIAERETETLPRADHPSFERVQHAVIATPQRLLDVAEALVSEGLTEGVVTSWPPFAGSVEALSERLCEHAASMVAGDVLVAGGEPTLRLPEPAGMGGRCQHLALLMAKRLAGKPYEFVAAASDGTDGPTDAGGAFVDGSTWSQLARFGDPERVLAAADSFTLLRAAGQLIRGTATGTNLCDLYLLRRV